MSAVNELVITPEFVTNIIAVDLADETTFTTADKAKLNGIEAGAQVNTVTRVAGKTGVVELDADDIAYDASETYASGKIGAALKSTEEKLDTIEEGAEVNEVNSVNSKSGDVVLNAGDIGYDGSTAYDTGTVGKELNELNRQISESVNVSVAEENLIVGRANADGTFSVGVTTGRYLFRSCVGVRKITYVSRYWGTPGAVFYDKKLNVLATQPNNTTTTPTVVEIPENAAFYAINAVTDMLDSMYVTEERYDVVASLSNKMDQVIANEVDVANEMVNHPVTNSGEIGGATNTWHVWRNCENIDILKIRAGYWSTPHAIFFASDGSVLSTVNWSSGDNTNIIPVPTGAFEYAVNCASDRAILANFAITEYTDAVKQIGRDEHRINELQPKYADLVLPSFIPAVVGLPSYLYWENIITNGFLKQYVVQITNGVFGAYPEALIRVPDTAGDNTVEVNLYDGYKAVKKSSTVIKTVAANTAGTAKCLIIGDSKSEASLPWITLKGYLDADSNLNMTFLGTHTTGPIKTEAYSGRSIVNVCDDEYITGTTPNIFYDASVTTANGHHFSFAKGVAALGDTPDIVFIDHGSNQYNIQWNIIKGCYDDVIASIHAVNSAIKVVVVIQEGQGIMRQRYNTHGKWWLENVAGYNAKQLLAEYRDRDSENIFVQPTYVCVDLYRDYPICLLPTFDGAEGEMEILMDSTHPGLNTAQWNTSTTYRWWDWVARNGKGYGCKKTNTNVDPETDDGTYWSECKNLGDGYRKKGLMYYCMLKYLMTV